MVKLVHALSRLQQVKILVIGDFILDTYTIGKAKRISPEAPVAVVNVHHEEHKPGGAGNVALNLVSLGAETLVIGRIGHDVAGQQLVQALHQEGINTHFLVIQEQYQTPVKTRVIADNQQIVRIDREVITALPEVLEQHIIEQLPFLLKEVKVIALSDYGKGFLTTTLLQAILSQAKEYGISVITDPKGHEFTKYAGTTVIKPNMGEAYAAANLPLQAPLELVAKRLLQMTQAEMLMITRSEAGLSLFGAEGTRTDFPVQVRQVKDVTGAGDTVLAMLAYAMANGLSFNEAAELCNIAAGLAVEQVGCARVTLIDVSLALLEQHASHKVFDEEHLFVLEYILKSRPFTLLALPNATQFTTDQFLAIQHLASDGCTLLIYLNTADPDPTWIQVLSSFKEVQFIIVHENSLRKLCEKTQPVKSYIIENKQFKLIPHFSVLFESSSHYK